MFLEKTSWWEHLEENTFTRHSMYNKTNETTKQLSFHSNLDSSQDSTAEWWKNLNLSNRGHTHKEDNVSRSSIQNFSAGIIYFTIILIVVIESKIYIVQYSYCYDCVPKFTASIEKL